MALPDDEFRRIADITAYRQLPISDQATIPLPESIISYGPEAAKRLFAAADFIEPHACLLGLPGNNLKPPYDRGWIMSVAFHPIGPVSGADVTKKNLREVDDCLLTAARSQMDQRRTQGLGSYDVRPLNMNQPALSMEAHEGYEMSARWDAVLVGEVAGELRYCQNKLRVLYTMDGFILVRFLAHPVTMFDIRFLCEKVVNNINIYREKLFLAKQLPTSRKALAALQDRPTASQVLEEIPLIWCNV